MLELCLTNSSTSTNLNISWFLQRIASEVAVILCLIGGGGTGKLDKRGQNLNMSAIELTQDGAKKSQAGSS